MTDFRAELQLLFDDAESFAEASLGHHYLWVAALNRAHAALAEDPVGPTDEESNAFAIVQMRLDDLAGDQELMIYRWPKAGDWDIQHTNPFSSVQLGEINGKYSCAGTTLEEAVRKLANALPAPSLKEQALELAKPAGIAGAYVTFGPEELDTIRKALEALPND